MMIRTFSVLCLTLGLIGGASARVVQVPVHDPTDNAIPQPGQRNVLIFIADDMGIDQSRQYRSITGNPLASLPATPNIQALANSGVTFDNAWANPVCSPTRAGLLTGRHSFRTTVANALSSNAPGLPLDETTLPELLKEYDTGYRSGLFGKWHLGTGDSNVHADPYGWGPIDHGFDEHRGSIEGELPDPIGMMNTSGYVWWDKYVNGVQIDDDPTTPVVDPVTEYATWANATDAIDWINAQDGRWLAIVAFNAPHKPLHTPAAACQAVSSATVADFNGMIECMDTQIGRFLSELHREDLEKTTIIFIGDNGTHRDQLLAPFDANQNIPSYKGNVNEGGIRVPFIVADGYHLAWGSEAPTTSGIGRIRSPGRRDDALVHTVDIFATVAAIAGAQSEAEDSFSLIPYMAPTYRYPLAPLRALNYTDRCQLSKFQAAIRNHAHKLIYELASPGTGSVPTQTLYDVTDLAEENPVIDPAVEALLLGELQSLWASGVFDPIIDGCP